MTALAKWLDSLGYAPVLLGLAAILAGCYFLFNAIPRTRHVKAQLLCVVGMDLITLLFFILTYSLRVSKMAAQSGATPRTLPRLWALLVGLGSIVSVLLFQWIGYYLSSAIFIVVVMVAMGEKSKLQLILTPIIWCVFTYFVFNKLLFISLPVGSLFKGIF